MTRCTRLAAAAALAFTFVAPAAFADATAVVTAPAKTDVKSVDAKNDPQAVVCVREDATGTRLGATKTCHTRAEWAARSAAAREQMNRIQNTPQTH